MATYDPERFAQAMEAAPKALYRNLRKDIDQFTLWFATRHFPRYMNQRLRRRTGALAKSFGRIVTGQTFADTRWNVYSTSPYAPYQQMGSESIVPTRSKYMTIPLSGAMTKTGRKRGALGWFEDTFVQRTKNGNLVVFQRTGKKRLKKVRDGKKDPSIRPLFLLRKQTKLEPRLRFFEEWDAQNDRLMERVAGAVERTLKSLEP